MLTKEQKRVRRRERMKKDLLREMRNDVAKLRQTFGAQKVIRRMPRTRLYWLAPILWLMKQGCIVFTAIYRWFRSLFMCSHQRNPAVRLVPCFSFPTETATVPRKTPQFKRFPLLGEIMAAVSMNTTQEFTVTINPVDRRGNPAPVTDAVWLADNTDVLALEPAADGLSCKVTAVGIAGTGMVQVSVDADTGAGVVPLVGTLDVEVTPAPATTIVLTPGPVTDVP